MKSSVFNMYWQAIDVLESQETLVAINVSSYPTAKKEFRDKLHRKLHKMAYPNTWNKAVKVDAATFLGMLSGK